MIESIPPPWMIPTNAGGPTTSDHYLNINEASKECGLSPSVLRIWELRYGWPNPRRKANGYRSYSPHLVEDLKRMAELVDEGTPIRQLIVDGLPQWPRRDDHPPALPRTLDNTRTLPMSSGATEQSLREELIRAIETHRIGTALEILQRAAWQLRQKDELDTALAPSVVGLAELDQLGRPFPGKRDAPSINNAIEGRCRQLLRSALDSGQPAARVLPLHSEDKALAWVICLALTRRHINAVIDDGSPLAEGDKLIIASNGVLSGSLVSKAVVVVGGLAADDRIAVKDLLNTEQQLDWLG